MNYASFGQRALALIIDLVPELVFYCIYEMFSSGMLSEDVLEGTIIFLTFSFYYVFFHARWGQTVGKMIMKIKVVSLNSQKTGFSIALKRYSIQLILGIYSVSLLAYDFLTLDEAALAEVRTVSRYIQILSHDFWPYVIMCAASVLWIVGNTLVFLFNKKRQTVHDLIAGTIVVSTR